ncbi:MAG: DNA polymerase III subunit epsilon [Alphaproteobacteria bacterium]|nr:DNA polymerase III subunit epsilon [Alphaproteobacteria bacterium]
MRQIVLDTETTGLNPLKGDRIVDIGCVELIDHVQTGRTWNAYFNPECRMPDEALSIHGLSDHFLKDKPLFSDLGKEFLDFIGEAHLIIHNASFDMSFINAELERANLRPLSEERVIDTLFLARRRYPGSPASLDALCKRYKIDLSSRSGAHGALIDARLLADVYLELIEYRQKSFLFEIRGLQEEGAEKKRIRKSVPKSVPERESPYRGIWTKTEQEAWKNMLTLLGTEAKWLKYRKPHRSN